MNYIRGRLSLLPTRESVLQIPRRVEYALRAAIALAKVPDTERVSFKCVADDQEIPRDYLAKILRTLVDAGIVASRRGANGGYRLARLPKEITFLEVIEAADSPVALNLCTESGTGCCKSGDCQMVSVWQAAEDAVRIVFGRTTLADVLGKKPLTLQELTANGRECPEF